MIIFPNGYKKEKFKWGTKGHILPEQPEKIIHALGVKKRGIKNNLV